MPLPVNAAVVRVRGYWFAQDGSGHTGTITFVPSASNLTDMGAFAYIKTATVTVTPHPSTGYYYADLLATNDPDLTPFAWTVTLQGQAPFTIAVPYDAPTVDVGSGDMRPAIWLVDAATITPPSPVATYYTAAQTDAAIANHAAAVDPHGDRAFAIRGNVLNWIGDSIAPPLQACSGIGGGPGAGVIFRPDDFVAYAHLASQGWLLYGKAAGIGGQNATQMIPRIVADALSHGGHFCGINTSPNDASAGRTAAQYAADIRTMCSLIVAAGQTPVIALPLTHTSNGSRKTMDVYRRFLVAYAAAHGWPIVDWQDSLVDPSTGGYYSAYFTAADGTNGLHPNQAGKVVMGQILADTLAPYLNPFTPPVPMVNDNAQTANLVNNALFLTDTNADGVPDGWGKSGSAVASIVTGDPGIRGNALRLTDAASSGFSQVYYPITITGLPGHKIAFTGRFKNPGTPASLALVTAGAATNLDLRVMSTSTQPLTSWQTWYLEAAIPTDATSLSVSLYTGGGSSVDASIAQIGVYDLTAAGL